MKFVYSAVLCLILFSCSANEQNSPTTSLELPETPVLTMENNWGLVTSPYVRIYSSTETSSKISGYLRKGAIVQLVDRAIFLENTDNNELRWYFVDNDEVTGWIQGSFVELYDSYDKAENAMRSKY